MENNGKLSAVGRSEALQELGTKIRGEIVDWWEGDGIYAKITRDLAAVRERFQNWRRELAVVPDSVTWMRHEKVRGLLAGKGVETAMSIQRSAEQGQRDVLAAALSDVSLAEPIAEPEILEVAARTLYAKENEATARLLDAHEVVSDGIQKARRTLEETIWDRCKAGESPGGPQVFDVAAERAKAKDRFWAKQNTNAAT